MNKLREYYWKRFKHAVAYDKREIGTAPWHPEDITLDHANCRHDVRPVCQNIHIPSGEYKIPGVIKFDGSIDISEITRKFKARKSISA